ARVGALVAARGFARVAGHSLGPLAQRGPDRGEQAPDASAGLSPRPLLAALGRRLLDLADASLAAEVAHAVHRSLGRVAVPTLEALLPEGPAAGILPEKPLPDLFVHGADARLRAGRSGDDVVAISFGHVALLPGLR